MSIKNTSEAVEGYIILKSLVFNNGTGFALGENLKEVQPYVTWQFTETNGTRDYYWGHYTTDYEMAERDYVERIAKHQRMYGVSERVPQNSIAERLRESGSQAVNHNTNHPTNACNGKKDRY